MAGVMMEGDVQLRYIVGCVPRPTAAKKELIFFFGSKRWLLWDFSPDRIIDGPKKWSAGWFANLPKPFSDRIDTVCEDPQHPTGVNTGRLLFFLEENVLQWDFTPDKSLGVKTIAEFFPGLSEEFLSDIDAAVRRPTKLKQIILFKGNRWVCYDTDKQAVVDGPCTFKERWFAALPEPFSWKVDAVVRRPTSDQKELIFFSGNQWLLWDFSPDQILEGPKKLDAGWFQNLGAVKEEIDDVYAVVEEEDPVKGLARRYAVMMGKVIAGLIRFIFEDVLSGGCQLIYLIKKWHHISLGSKAFTLSSIFAGVCLSLAGPLYEYLGARKLQSQANELQEGSYLPVVTEEKTPLLKGNAEDIESPTEPVPKLDEPDDKSDAKDQAATTDEERKESKEGAASAKKKKRRKKLVTVVPNIKVAEFLRGEKGGEDAEIARRMLAIGAAVFWVTMICIPFAMKIECGRAIPATGTLAFFGLSMTLSILEIWVTIHAQHGYLMFKHRTPKYIMGYFLSHVGRFDTYSDVTFARMIHECEPITWFSIKDHYFYLPFGLDLARMVLFIVVVGVFLCQAVPGLIMLCSGTNMLPISLKLNEYNLLLAVMEQESKAEEVEKAEDLEASKMALLGDVAKGAGVVATMQA